jgi:uncharacterized alkaline shock family protein YloU
MDVAQVQPGTTAPDDSAANSQKLGKVEVSPIAVATVISRAVLKCYGVVGMAARHPIGQLLRIEERNKGVEVNFDQNNRSVTIDLYVIIEYGTRIAAVANNIMSTVKFAVESSLGLPVAQVNVNVQGIRVSKSDEL